MKAYRKGVRAEYLCMERLRNLGADVVIRSAGSHGLIDVIAIFSDRKEIWLIQVKRGADIPLDILKSDYRDLGALMGTYHVIPMFFIKRGREYKLIPFDGV
ncbi:MAG: hypothetical protein DRP01_11355 [Archaeoglobales archaeon]|nr:MAG: hypothetical protein DRP01_11355 [Archaeoglobales archaeon]